MRGDEKHEQPWADKTTGQSAHTWGRAMGWFSMALVDALEFIPTHEEGRDSVMAILQNVAAQIQKWQEPKSGLWYQVIDCSGREGQLSGVVCFGPCLSIPYIKVYVWAISDPAYLEVAEKGYEGFLKDLSKSMRRAWSLSRRHVLWQAWGVRLTARGDYDYYIHEKIRANDPKAVGTFHQCFAGEGAPRPSARCLSAYKIEL